MSNYLGSVSGSTGANTGLVFADMPKDQVLALDMDPTGTQLFVGSAANRAVSVQHHEREAAVVPGHRR